jgi:pimeloyl-ACP methyl ester carboxylesterase
MKDGMAAPYPAPMLLLPGLICDARIWAPQLAAFAELSPVAVDGYGDARSLEAMADRALAVAPRRFSLAGHSMGARVALEVYRKAPERVERLALLSTGTHPVKPGEAEGRHRLLALGREQGVDALIEAWLLPMLTEAHCRDPRLVEPLWAMCRDAGVDRYEAQITALLARPTLEELLPAIACPTLIACGRDDAWAPIVQHEATAALVPGAELTVFEQCGHMAPVEAPDQVNSALRRWLARAPFTPTRQAMRHQEKTQ